TVIGGSGSGKSSLVFAGLVPRLRKTNLFGPGQWLVRSMRPGERPLAELARALGADPGNPAAAVAEALKAVPEAKRLLLVVDQFGLREAIYRPAETVGVYVESALVERLASDAVEARSLGILPLVQEVLVQLWEKLERRVLPLHAYAEFVLPRNAYAHHQDGQE